MRKAFWNYLFEQSEALVSLNIDNYQAKAEFIENLNSFKIHFEHQFDPVDNFEEFVAFKLNCSILAFLSRQQP